MEVIVIEIESRVESSVWIRLTSGWVDDVFVLEMADKEEKKSEQMRKRWECE